MGPLKPEFPIAAMHVGLLEKKMYKLLYQLFYELPPVYLQFNIAYKFKTLKNQRIRRLLLEPNLRVNCPTVLHSQ